MVLFNAGDHAGFLQIFSPDVIVRGDPQVADRPEYRGREGVAAWFEEAARRWQAVRFKALAVEPAGDDTLVELAVVGDTGAGGGAWRLYIRLVWNSEHVQWLRVYQTRADAIGDAGPG